jgi:hypothetical protein
MKAAEAIMKAVRETLSESGFYFEAGFASILSGEEEGLYSLVAVNILGSVYKVKIKKLKKGYIKPLRLSVESAN